MSNESRSSTPAASANAAAASAPAAGPDSSSRTGKRAAVSTVAIPPPENMTKKRPRKLVLQVVELVALLPPDLDRVAEAGRREQRRPRALALDDRVRDEGRAVHEPLQVGDGDARAGQGLRQHALDRLGRPVRRR